MKFATGSKLRTTVTRTVWLTKQDNIEALINQQTESATLS